MKSTRAEKLPEEPQPGEGVAAPRDLELAFPFPEPRASQDILVRDLDDAVANGLTVLCSAPTGIGKTAAALYPLLRRALGERRKLFFVTAKTSQQALALDTLRRMIPPGAGVSALQLAAKRRSCPLDDAQCRRSRCRFQRRFTPRLEDSGLLDELAVLGVVDAETITERSLAAQLCPFEVSLALALRASVIVSDFNYVFDPNVYLRRFFDKPYDRHLLVVDEAHNLPARAAGYYSPTLELPVMRSAARACLEAGGVTLRGAGELLNAVASHCEERVVELAQERDGVPPFVEQPDRIAFEAFAAEVDDVLMDYALYAAGGGEPPALPPLGRVRHRAEDPDRLLGLLGELRDFCRCSQEDPDLFATLWSPASVRMLCLDPAPFLRTRLEGFHAAVYMSATLTPLDFFGRALGADGLSCVSLELPSPFPRENRLLLGVRSVDTTYKRRSESAPEIARIIVEAIRLRRGNYLAFFSSFAYRDEVVSQLAKGDYRTLIQLPGMPVEPLLARLRENRDGTLLLCGVQGGVLSEGVDYPGDMAIGVFVVGPGLPAVTLEQELIREYYEQRLGAGFEYAYMLPGLTRAVQAGGRVIRSASDRGFVMLLCRRFAEARYRDRLPAYWREELLTRDDPIPRLREFWG